MSTASKECDYCRKPIDGTPVYRTIHFRGREMRRGRYGRMQSTMVVKTRQGTFCSTTCATHEQMGCEG